MKLPRRAFLQLAAGAAALPAVARVAWAQAYPTRPITLVVPIAPGGGVDGAARILSEKLQEKLKQSVVVENRPGAGSIIGTNSVAKAPPDGYTLLLMELGAVLAKWLNRTVPFDVTSDFTPIAMVATSPLVLFAHPSVAFHDIKGLIAYGKANPGTLSVGIPGLGTPHHLAAAWLNTAAKVEITLVPYRGAAASLNDLLGGQIPLIWAAPIAVRQFVEQGKVKVLGVSAPRRLPMFPQAPTVSESGVSGFDVTPWYGVAAPARVSHEVVARVGEAVRETIELPDIQQRMSTVGLNGEYRNSAQFRELIISDHQKYGAVIREAGIQPQ